MVRTPKLSYFVTESGRRLVLYGSTTIAIGLFAGNYLPHTVGIKYYRELFQAYRNGQAQELSEKLMQRFNRAVQLLNLSEIEKKYVKPFVVIGFDLFNAGSLKARYGGFVGIPANFEYNTTEDIDKSGVVFQGRKINWASDAGKLLDESLVLSEDEQVFGIAREILISNTHKRLVQALIASASWVVTYSLASQINHRYNFYARPLSLRITLYAICGMLGYGMYSMSTDMTEIYYDTETDKKLATLGPDVADAGARFYDKILKKNIAMRKITGDDYYTAKGNVNYLIRQKATPLTLRKEFFQTGYKDYIGNTENS